MKRFFGILKTLFSDTTLRRRVLFVIGALFIFRLLAAIPVPTIQAFQIEQFFQTNQFFGLVNLFSGGGLDNLSIVMLGVGPYITASIIMQLSTMISPRLKALYHEQGEIGRRKFIQISRLLTVPLAVLQAYGFLTILARQGVLLNYTSFELITSIVAIVAGSMLLMWIGELITEFGIGNGTSIIIFAGIVAALPSTIVQLYYSYDPSQIPLYISVLALGFVVILGAVIVTESERPIPITYAKQVRGNSAASGGVSTYLPLRLNQAGVIPIIFAISILLFPQMLLGFLGGIDNSFVQSISAWLTGFYANQFAYAATYFVLVFVFTFFYTAVTFEPDAISENLQKNGAFIPGVRPGQSTADFLGKVLLRITLAGALFLGFIAVLPVILQQVTGIQALAIGGTALLIVVSVVVDLIKKIDAQIAMRQY